MSGFKSWKNSNNSSESLGGSSSGGGIGNTSGGSGASSSTSTFQWGETPTTLTTNKNVFSSQYMFSDLGFFTSSDSKFKSNVKNLSQDKKEHLDKLKKLIPKSYNFKNQENVSFGLIAQEVEKIYPSLVLTNEDGSKSVNYTELIPLLLLQTNEMERKIEDLKNNN